MKYTRLCGGKVCLFVRLVIVVVVMVIDYRISRPVATLAADGLTNEDQKVAWQEFSDKFDFLKGEV